MVPDSHPAIISWELFDEISALREAEQAVKEERKSGADSAERTIRTFSKAESFAKVRRKIGLSLAK